MDEEQRPDQQDDPVIDLNVVNTNVRVNGVIATVERIQWIMSVLVIALFIGFSATFVAAAALLWDAFTSKAASYQNLQDEVQAQNMLMQSLISEVQELRQTQNKPDQTE